MESKLDTLAKGLKKAREKSGYSQPKLAEKLGVHVHTVRNWEQGISKPEVNTLFELQRLYHCDIAHLFGEIEGRTHDTNYIMQQTGLTESAVNRLRINKVRHEAVKELLYNYEPDETGRTMADYLAEEGVTSNADFDEHYKYSSPGIIVADFLSFLILSEEFEDICSSIVNIAKEERNAERRAKASTEELRKEKELRCAIESKGKGQLFVDMTKAKEKNSDMDYQNYIMTKALERVIHKYIDEVKKHERGNNK